MDNLLSIIVPVYNIADYLEECIDSILAQTYENIEVILVDDGSTDESSQICNRYQQENEKVIVIHQENKGLPGARNTGISVAKGNFIGFIDGDDTIDKKMYEIMIDALIRNDADFAFSVIKRMYGEQCDNITANQEVLIEGKDIVKARFDMYEAAHIGKSVCDKVFRRELLEGSKFLEGLQQGEDNLFMAQLVFKCRKCVFIGKELYFYRDIREGNFSSRDTLEKIFAARIPVRKSIIELLEQNNYFEIADVEKKKMYDDFLNYLKKIVRSDYKKETKKLFLKQLDEVILSEEKDIKRIYKKGIKQWKCRIKWRVYFSFKPLFQKIIFIKYKFFDRKDI